MLILDKRRAIERIVALTAGAPAPVAEDEQPALPRARVKRHIATRERRVERAVVAEDDDAAEDMAGRRGWAPARRTM